MSLTFQPISLDNVSSLMAIENACHSHPWSEKTFKSCLGERYFAYYGKQDETLIGFYVGEHVAGEATLMDICITPEQQGNGLGNTLLEHFIAQAKALNNEKIWLEVRAKNIAAQMLYINHGFIEVNRRVGYYPSASGFGYEDAIVMSLSL